MPQHNDADRPSLWGQLDTKETDLAKDPTDKMSIEVPIATNEEEFKGSTTSKQESSGIPAPQETENDGVTSSKRDCFGFRLIFRFWHGFWKKWPRTYSVIFCVIIPLFIIVGLSMLFGKMLAQMEAEHEIESNNAAIAAKARIQMFSGKVENITANVPLFCLDAYFNRNRTIPTEEFIKSRIDTMLDNADGLIQINLPKRAKKFFNSESGNSTVNLMKMSEFMATCGSEVKEITTMVLNTTFGIITDEGGIGDITFNWIRCTHENETILKTFGDFLTPGVGEQVSQLQKQELYVQQAWLKHQEELYLKLFDEYYEEEDNSTRGNAEFQALYDSIGNATGFDKCGENHAAAGWFWFTIMTTVGYGNTSPVTAGGRAMVFTLGFASILIFATFLSRAGVVVTSLFDDVVSRWSVTDKIFRSFLGAQLVFWGLLYYLWMLVIANYYKDWKEKRLGEEFELGDAYWYAFITSTTVGLGDYYLDPQVFLEEDFIMFSLLFLFAFVLLANFLVRLTRCVIVFIPDKVDTLDERLQKTNLIVCARSSSSRTADKNSNKHGETVRDVDDNKSIKNQGSNSSSNDESEIVDEEESNTFS